MIVLSKHNKKTKQRVDAWNSKEKKDLSASPQDLPAGLTLRANVSWTFVGNVVTAASWFSMTIVLAKLGSPEDVGQFALALATTAPIFMFATLRLRDVQATDTGQDYHFGDYLGLRLTTTLLALLVVGAIVAVSGFERVLALVILAMAVSKAIEAMADVIYGRLMQQERMDGIAKSMLMKGPLSLLGLSIGFYVTGSLFWGVVGLVAARAVIFLGYDLHNLNVSFNPSAGLTNHINPRNLPRPHWDRETLAKLVRLALPLGLVTMLISFNSNIPRYFVEGHLGAYYLGIFAAIASFQKVAPTVVQALGRSASPRLAKYHAAVNVKSFRNLSMRMVGLGILLGVGGVLVAVVAGRLILTTFYGPEYAMPELFGLMMVAAGLDYIATMLLFVLTSARLFKVQFPLQVLTTGTVALACFWLVPSYGLTGAALALILGNLVRAGSVFIAALYAQHALGKQSAASKSLTSAY